jgi:hypothetical protein
MAFAVEDFHDLVRLLEQHPEWRAQLRRLLLPDELLTLPELIRSLALRVEELAEAQRRTDERLGELAEAQRRTADAVHTLVERMGDLDTRVGKVVGELLELRYERHAGAYFGRLLRRVRMVGDDERETLLEAGEASGTLAETEANTIRLSDLILRGRRRDDGQETLATVEVSVGVGTGDVERASKRAALLGRIRPTLPVVAGEWMTPDAREMAAGTGVWAVLNGEVVPPGIHA